MRVLIGVQARSSSTRLVGKSSMKLGDVAIVSRVMTGAYHASKWFKDVDIDIVMLIPFDDPLREEYLWKAEIFEGPEQDVLTRYYAAMDYYEADYVVRLTGDCAWIQPRVIAKALRACIKNDSDYCSNVLVRTYMEGLDVEVLSRPMMDWLENSARSEHDREHVTTFLLNAIKENTLPVDFKTHTIFDEYDNSAMKTSIDTPEEYRNSVRLYNALKAKKDEALCYGSISN